MNHSVYTPTPTPGALFASQQPVLLSSSSIPTNNNNLLNSLPLILAVVVVTALIAVVINIFKSRRTQKKNKSKQAKQGVVIQGQGQGQGQGALGKVLLNIIRWGEDGDLEKFTKFLDQHTEEYIINLYDPNGYSDDCSPLHAVCHYVYPTFVQPLLDKDTNKVTLNQVSKIKFTPLMSACYNMLVSNNKPEIEEECNNRYKTISILLKNMKPDQINMKPSGWWGSSALDVLVYRYKTKMEYEKKHKNEDATYQLYPCEENFIKTVKLLLHYGAEPTKILTELLTTDDVLTDKQKEELKTILTDTQTRRRGTNTTITTPSRQGQEQGQGQQQLRIIQEGKKFVSTLNKLLKDFDDDDKYFCNLKNMTDKSGKKITGKMVVIMYPSINSTTEEYKTKLEKYLKTKKIHLKFSECHLTKDQTKKYYCISVPPFPEISIDGGGAVADTSSK